MSHYHFFFDPDSTDPAKKNPQITFKIEDKGDVHQYRWEVKIRSTSSENRQWEVFARGKVAQPGLKTITLGAPSLLEPLGADTQQGDLIYKGTYTFDIQVKEFFDATSTSEAPMDEETLKSPFLTIPEWISAPDTNDDGMQGHHFYMDWDSQEHMHAKVTYWLEDTQGTDATKVRVDFFNHEWELLAFKDGPTAGGLSTTVRVNHSDNELYAFQGGELAGNYKAVFSATDGHALDYRDHLNRNMLTVNGYNPSLGVEWIEGVFRGVSWFGCWVKLDRQLIAKPGLPVKLETQAIGLNSTTPTLEVISDRLCDNIVSPGPWLIGGIPTKNLTWGAINGTYFADDAPGKDIIGEVGDPALAPSVPAWTGAGCRCPAKKQTGAVWPATADNPLKRWAFGINNNHISVVRMKHAPTPGPAGTPQRKTYRAPYSFKAANPYGMSGVGRYFNGSGVIEAFPPRIFSGTDESSHASKTPDPTEPGGVYDYLDVPYARSILLWDKDQKHCFFVMSQQFAKGNLSTAWDLKDAQAFLTDQTVSDADYDFDDDPPSTFLGIKGYIRGYTRPGKLRSSQDPQQFFSKKVFPFGNGLDIGSVWDAILLDGGTHAAIAWSWAKNPFPPGFAAKTPTDKTDFLKTKQPWNERPGDTSLLGVQQNIRSIIQAH